MAVQRKVRPAAQGETIEDAEVRRAADRGTRGPSGLLPHLSTIQRAFGRHDVRGARAHVGSGATEAARAMGAEAFAAGDHVSFAGAPDLRTAAHEAAHVVQQRGGVRLGGGVGRVGDAYERNADAVADAVVAGRSAEGLLGQSTGKSGTASSGVVQQQVSQNATGQWVSTDLPGQTFPTQQAAAAAEQHARAAAMYPLPLAFGHGAPYGHHGFPELGPVAPQNVEHAQQRVSQVAPMLSTLAPQNLQFTTHEAPRAPTLYFRSEDHSGRVRQEHPDGPAVFTDRVQRDDRFSHNPDLLDMDDSDDHRGVDRYAAHEAQPGMHHIEIEHDEDGRGWRNAHPSGGTFTPANLSDHEVDTSILRAALNPNARVEDREQR